MVDNEPASSLVSDGSDDSPYSSLDTSPTIRRPFTTVGWEHPYSCVSPSSRPSTTIGWESRVLEKATLVQGKKQSRERRHSTGSRRTLETNSDWCLVGGQAGEKTSSEDSDEDLSSCKGSLLDLIQSKKKKKEKFRQLLQRLMHESSSINCTGEHCMTLLHYAVLSGDKMCVEALIAFGANINAKNSFNQTPLDVAAENQQDHLIPLLVSIGCRPGMDIPGTPPQNPTRRRAVSNPHDPPNRSKLSGPNTAHRRNSQGVKYGEKARSSSEKHEMKKGSSELLDQMGRHINQRLEATQSVNLDEAWAIAMQQQEIARLRSKCSPGPSTCPLTSPPTTMVSRVCGSRILSLDGGGIRALVQIDILCEIERLTGKKITQLFDWIIGTSSGGIVALLLVYQQMPLSQIRNLYFQLKEEVFSKGRVGFCYDSVRLEELLKESLGTEMRMGDVIHPKVLVAAVDKSNIPLKLNFFNNCFGDEFSRQYVWKVARCTSAAPMYFTEFENYVDGGVIANNPCIDGLNKIQTFYEEQGIHFPIACMVSLGSGISPSQELGPVDFHVFLRLRFAGMFKKAQSLISMLSSAIGESEALAERCRTSCAVQKIPFFRFNPQLGEKVDSGMTDNHKLLQMIITTRIYTHTQESQLEQLLGLLLKDAEL